jgi:hypothetical protein
MHRVDTCPGNMKHFSTLVTKSRLNVEECSKIISNYPRCTQINLRQDDLTEIMSNNSGKFFLMTSIHSTSHTLLYLNYHPRLPLQSWCFIVNT